MKTSTLQLRNQLKVKFLDIPATIQKAHICQTKMRTCQRVKLTAVNYCASNACAINIVGETRDKNDYNGGRWDCMDTPEAHHVMWDFCCPHAPWR